MNPTNKNLNNENNDKTIIFNSLIKNEETNLEKTQVEQNISKTNQSLNDEKTIISSNSDLSVNKNLDNKNDQKIEHKQKEENKKNILIGVAAAGIVGAGGIVAGTIYSEEIKGVVDGIATDLFGNSEEIPEVSEVMNNNSATLTFSDATGVYEVTLSDTIGDGNIDTLNVQAQLVDGTNVQFTASNSFLDQLFNNENIEVASANDYLSNISGVFEAFTPESLNGVGYQIQQGDTLSEIAAANNTTIDQIMELNPNVTDSNLIYAGNELIIPSHDNFSTPQDELNPHWNESSDVFIAQNDTNFDAVDWSSFEDQPLGDYSGFLHTENFDNYLQVDSYLNNSNELLSSEFLNNL